MRRKLCHNRTVNSDLAEDEAMTTSSSSQSQERTQLSSDLERIDFCRSTTEPIDRALEQDTGESNVMTRW